MLEALLAGIYLAVSAMMAAWAAWCVRRLGRHAFIAVLAGGYAVVYGLVPTLRIVTGASTEPSSTAAVASALGATGLFIGWRWGGAGSSALRLPGKTVAELTDCFRTTRFLLACTCTAAFGFALTAISSAGSIGNFMAAGRFESRGEGGLIGTVIGPLMVRMIIVPIFILSASPNRRHRVVGVGYALSSASFLFVATAGARSLAIGVIGASMIGVVLAQRRSRMPFRRGGEDLRALARLGIGVLVIAATGVLVSGLYEARKTLRSEGLASVTSSLRSAASLDTLINGEPFTYSLFLERAVDTYPEHEDFLWLYPLRRLIFFFPGFGDLKPPDTNLVFAQAIGVGGETTIPPSLPGEGYVVMGGVLGSLTWAALYGLVIGWLTSSRKVHPLALVLLTAAAVDQGLLALRGQFYEVAISLLVTYALLRVLWVVVSPRSRVARRRPDDVVRSVRP